MSEKRGGATLVLHPSSLVSQERRVVPAALLSLVSHSSPHTPRSKAHSPAPSFANAPGAEPKSPLAWAAMYENAA